MGFRRLILILLIVALVAIPLKTAPAQESGNDTATLEVSGAPHDCLDP